MDKKQRLACSFFLPIGDRADSGKWLQKNVNNFALLKLKISYFCSYNGVYSKVSY
jgi:hypothetical protein